MGDYEIYKSFGRSIGKKEWDAKINYNFAPWYKKPYYSFIIWVEHCKRYIQADYHTRGDKPFIKLVYWCILLMLLIVIIIVKT